MARRAVLVGINEFKTLPMNSWLEGCVNDANDIAAALRKRGFTSRNLRVLLDADATKSNVMAALTAMVESAKTGDHLIFSFSSHGTQVPNLPGDDAEPDGLDEVFACYDLAHGGDSWDRATVISDDELRVLFATLPPGVLLEVLLDTCHSGTGLRDIDDVLLAAMSGRRPRYLPPPTPRGLAKARSLRAVSAPRKVDRKALVELTKGKAGGSKPVLFAACRPDETATDARFEGGRANGAFTYLFLKALKDKPDSSRTELLRAVIAGLQADDFEQRSTLEGPLKSKQAPFGQPW